MHTSHAAWAVLAGCGAMVTVLGIASTGPWALASAERPAAEIDPVPEGAR